MGIAGDFAVIMVFALIGGLIAQFLRMPLVVGYILAGIVVGPHTPGPTVTQVHDIEMLADLGVALLLFTIGLEFTPGTLRPVLLISALGTPVQVALTTVLGFGLGMLLGLTPLQGLWLGCLISLSSTMVALKQLTSMGQGKALSGRVMMGMLVVQDLIAIPLMVLLPSLGKTSSEATPLWVPLAKAVGLVLGCLLFGSRILPRLLGAVTRSGSHELFLVAVGGVAFGVGYISHLSGLSFALGAFLAGLVLSESEYSHHALGSVSPLRDIFGMLFFVSVGMLLDPTFLVSNLLLVLVLTGAIMVGKGVIFASTAAAFGYRNIVPIALGLSLGQVGEFSIVLARSGFQQSAIDTTLYNLVLTVAILTMVLSPFCIRLTAPVYRLWRRYFPAPFVIDQEEKKPASNFVLIGGYGRVGRRLAKVLLERGFSCLAIDCDWSSGDRATKDGVPFVLGDLTSDELLQSLELPQARQAVLTFNDPSSLHLAIEGLRKHYPGLEILAEAQSENHLQELLGLGVSRAVLPELESALEFVRLALGCQSNDSATVEAAVQAERQQLYGISP